jgi:NADP-dependent 3-hydroxy acid dehydrogenase YdfG
LHEDGVQEGLLVADNIAESVVHALTRPAHVAINEVLIEPQMFPI